MSVMRLACCLILLLPWCGHAEDGYSIDRVHFLPPTYYVGDVVEARVRLSVNGDAEIREPDELPPPGNVHIRDIRIIPISDEYDVRISFSCYETGEGELPSIDLGDITLTGVPIEVESILQEGDTTIEDAFGPTLLPGSRLMLALFAGGLLTLPPLVVLAVVWLRRFIENMRVKWKDRKPLKELNNDLDALVSAKTSSREFYIELTGVFRRYLTHRLSIDTKASTASELARDLRQLLQGVEAVDKISNELPGFDAVKFGGRRIKRQQRQADIGKVREAALAIEEWKQGEAHRVDA